ncbi:MAG TPA: DUF952 domain-containing protein [Anaerolineae bacterium]|nr:DUF952 domain-containing protein [Anaerolineae bacterium]
MSHKFTMTPQNLPIYHLTPASIYYRQPENQPYQTETLAQEGFIHCTAGAEKLIEVANTYFADLQDNLLVLEVDLARLTAPLLFEPPILPIHAPVSIADLTPSHQNTLFPHIYGPLDRQAIIACFRLQRDETGRWQMPKPAADG